MIHCLTHARSMACQATSDLTRCSCCCSCWCSSCFLSSSCCMCGNSPMALLSPSLSQHLFFVHLHPAHPGLKSAYPLSPCMLPPPPPPPPPPALCIRVSFFPPPCKSTTIQVSIAPHSYNGHRFHCGSLFALSISSLCLDLAPAENTFTGAVMWCSRWMRERESTNN